MELMKAAINRFDNATATSAPSGEESIIEVLDGIRNGRWKHAIVPLRAAVKEHGRKSALVEAAKKELPAVTFSGTFDGKRRKESLQQHSGFLCIDFDDLPDPEQTKTQLKSDPRVLAAFISPTGTGLKVLVPVEADDADTHERAFVTAQRHFEERHGLMADKSGKDVSRLCFVSYDPTAFIGEERHWESAIPFVPADNDVPDTNGATEDRCENQSPASRSNIESALMAIPTRPDYDTWLRISSAVFSELPMEEACSLLNRWSPEEQPQEYQRKYQHRLTDIKIGTLFHIAQSHGWRASDDLPDYRLAPMPTATSAKPIRPSKRFIEISASQDQAGAAEMLIELGDGRILFDHTAGLWRVFRNGIWERDEMRGVRAFAREELQNVFRAAARERRKEIDTMLENGASKREAEESEAGKAWTNLMSQVKSLNRRNYLDHVLNLAGDGERLGVLTTDFDRDPMLFATANGVLDLRTFSFREAKPEDRLSKRSLVQYMPEAACPKWLEFIQAIFCGDSEIAAFMQRLWGYCLSGEVGLDAVSIAYGGGGNGKSVAYSILSEIFGDYASHLPIEALLQQGPRRDASTDYEKMKLLGARFVVASEIPEHRRMNESLIKDISGGDLITARSPYEKPITFNPTHKLFLMGNHRPEIRGTDEGIWRRLYLVPFNHRFPQPGEPGHRPKEAVLRELRTEASGILNWLLQGLRDLRENGLNPPASVRAATEEFRRESDQIQRFIDDCCIVSESYSAGLAELFKLYTDHCESDGERPLGKQKFSKALEKKGFQKERHNTGIRFSGITNR